MDWKIRKFRGEPGDRLEMAVFHLLRLAEMVVFFGSFTYLTADWAALWLFREKP